MAVRDAKGRTLPYKDSPGLLVETSVLVPMCDKCGEMLLDHSAIIALDAALEHAYQRQRR